MGLTGKPLRVDEERDRMGPTSLSLLLKEDGVTCTPNGLIVTIHSSWIIEGEDRLSYTTLIRLVECCREHHWNTDILAKAQGSSVDAIAKSLTGEFMRPIIVGSRVSIVCRVAEVRPKSYLLKFEIRDAIDQTLHAEVSLVCVFYDPIARKSATPPTSITNQLLALLERGKSQAG